MIQAVAFAAGSSHEIKEANRGERLHTKMQRHLYWLRSVARSIQNKHNMVNY